MKQTPSLNQKNQQHIFYLLHDFAFRLSVRYSSIAEDPNEMMYQAFARLFLEKAQLNPSNVISLKRRFTALVIIICMEQQKCRKLSREVSYKVPVVEERDTVELFHMPAKTMIDALRAVNFESRMVYNMAVIDGIKMHEVTRILHISIDSANEYLQLAREQLVELFGQMASEQV